MLRPFRFMAGVIAAVSLTAALLAPKDGFWLMLLPAFMLVRSARKGAQ